MEMIVVQLYLYNQLTFTPLLNHSQNPLFLILPCEQYGRIPRIGRGLGGYTVLYPFTTIVCLGCNPFKNGTCARVGVIHVSEMEILIDESHLVHTHMISSGSSPASFDANKVCHPTWIWNTNSSSRLLVSIL